jgi:hypothetical protein
MASSGTSTFTETRDQLITRAMRQCSAIQAGEIPQAADIQTCSEALNAMIKEWDALGIHVWTETEGVLFPQPNQEKYYFGPGSTDHTAEYWLLSSLAEYAPAGATTLTLNAIQLYGQSQIVNGDNIGIVLDSGFVFWTIVAISYVIDLANPYLTDENGIPIYSGDPLQPLIYLNPPPYNIPILVYFVQLANPLPSSASANNYIFDYTTGLLRPLRIPSSRRFFIGPSNPTSPIYGSRIDTPMLVYSRLDYHELPNKRLPGVPTAFFYDPQLNLGQYYLWPAPLNVTALFKFTWYRQIQDFNNPTDNPDLPQEWLNTIAWNLAKEIGPEYDVPIQKYQIILQRAEETLDRASGWDKESESIYFGLANSPSSR